MNAPAAPLQATPTGAMIRTLGLVSALCGLAIVCAYEGTAEAVRANRQLALERTVFKVLPGAATLVDYLALASGRIVAADDKDPPAGAIRFQGAYDGAGKLTGIAAEGGAAGYADVVRVMFGYRPDCACIVGFGVIASRETPGIGDRVGVDPAFLANFAALDVRLDASGSALANELQVVRHGTRSQPWQIDAIAGATVTSRAVGKGINETARVLLPRLAPHLDQIRSKP